MGEKLPRENFEASIDELLAAGNEANQNLPLSLIAIAPAIALKLLQPPLFHNLSLEEFALAELNERQSKNLRTTMERLHRAFGINYFPDNARLQSLWFQYKRSAILTIATVWSIVNPEQKIDTLKILLAATPEYLAQLIQPLSEALHHIPSQFFEIMQSMLKIMVDSISLEQGRKIAQQHRETVVQAFQKYGLDSDRVQDAVSLTSTAITTLMIKALVEAYPQYRYFIYKEFQIEVDR